MTREEGLRRIRELAVRRRVRAKMNSRRFGPYDETYYRGMAEIEAHDALADTIAKHGDTLRALSKV